ncbi:hypothetical protein HHI36_023134 [Cryptolaemus montrouzieri]|uniref:Uncharacterized protein n=1 Tax=Cryptolaemus montrouzieri TaxID=559131 RepID=A0ABD2PG39_9CUCU
MYLILVNDRNLFSELEYQPPVGKSYYVVLNMKMQFYETPNYSKNVKKIEITNYQRVSEAMQLVDWNELWNPDDVNDIKDKKAYFKYIRSTLNTKVSIPSVRDNVGNLSTDNKTSASIFVDTFSKALSREPAGPLPKISTRRIQNTISDVTISPELVEAAIRGLKSNSSPGLDGISVKLNLVAVR